MNYQTFYPDGFINHRWNKMKERVLTNPNYIDIKIDMDREDFARWIEPQWPVIEYYWVIGEEPSIDRIDPKKDYRINNLRIISKTLNSLLGTIARNEKRSEKLRKDNPPKICVACGRQYKRTVRKTGRSESYTHYKQRKTCGLRCAFLLRKHDEYGRLI
jgi:hypothetical protein